MGCLQTLTLIPSCPCSPSAPGGPTSPCRDTKHNTGLSGGQNTLTCARTLLHLHWPLILEAETGLGNQAQGSSYVKSKLTGQVHRFWHCRRVVRLYWPLTLTLRWYPIPPLHQAHPTKMGQRNKEPCFICTVYTGINDELISSSAYLMKSTSAPCSPSGPASPGGPLGPCKNNNHHKMLEGR